LRERHGSHCSASGKHHPEGPDVYSRLQNARAIADRVGRDKLLFALLENFFDKEQNIND
jgi:hypothetical protein